MLVIIGFAVFIVILCWNNSSAEKEHKKRENILHQIDRLRMKEIDDLKREVERLKSI